MHHLMTLQKKKEKKVADERQWPDVYQPAAAENQNAVAKCGLQLKLHDAVQTAAV